MDKKQKQIIKISVFITSIFVILLSVTYAFINVQLTGTKKQVITAGTLDLELQEENEITITDALPMYDEVGMIQDAFTFSLTNTGDAAVDYTLKLTEITTIQSDQQCSSLGEITTSTPRECWKAEYPDELRTEALAICKGMYSEITTESECVTACLKYGAPFTTFDGFIDYVIEMGELEDTRTVAETYPDNYILEEFPKLDKYNVKYGLTIDGFEKIDYISNTTYNGELAIDAGSIETNQTIEYELRLWIDAKVTNNEDINGKSLKFRVEVDAGQKDISTNQSYFTYELSNYIVKNYHACAEFLVEKGISTDYDTAILTDCQSITEGDTTIQNSYPTEFQEMIDTGIVSEEYGATITGYNYASDSVVIPSTISVDGSTLNQEDIEKIEVPVVAIADNGLDKVYISGVNSSEKQYYAKPMSSPLTQMSKIIIPDSVLFVGEGVFSGILTNYFKNSTNLQVAGNDSFRRLLSDSKIKNIVLPEALTYIGEGAFASNDFESVILPENLIKIRQYAFDSNNLTTVTIPKNVTEIGTGAFYDYFNTTTKIINKTGIAFDWYDICFNVSGQDSFVTGTLTNDNHTIEVVSE